MIGYDLEPFDGNEMPAKGSPQQPNTQTDPKMAIVLANTSANRSTDQDQGTLVRVDQTEEAANEKTNEVS